MKEYKKTIDVMIVEDSPLDQELLMHIINTDPTLQVIKVVQSAGEALSSLDTIRPDVITIDINLPGMDGYELTKKIMGSNPIPIVIISGQFSSNDIKKSFKSIEVGAVSILEKPSGPGNPGFHTQADAIRKHIKTASYMMLVPAKEELMNPVPPYSYFPKESDGKETAYKCIAIGGSLGGPQALCSIFSQLPSYLPLPIFVVQHISPGFTKGLVEWMRDNTKLGVFIGQEGQRAIPGEIYFAPDSYHMLIDSKNTIRLEKTRSHAEIQPSVGRLFQSVAEAHGPHSIAILLTGMGRDGAKEMLQLKEKGATTVAQDKDSSVIFGMPWEAIKLGAARHVTPLDKIPQLIIQLLKKDEVKKWKTNNGTTSKF